MRDELSLLDPKMDYIFKCVFGTEETKPLLISFLNALLKRKPYIKSITLLNPEFTKTLKEDKTSRLDIRAQSDDGTMFDIEIQIKNTGEIPERALHYAANMFPRLVSSNESYKVARVISIWILGENVTKRTDAISEAYMTFKPSIKDSHEIMTDSLRIFFIELQKFNPKKADMHDLLTAWLAFLKNPALMDQAFLKIKEIASAMNKLQYISSDREVRELADLRQRTINDRNSELTVKKEEGRIEGREEEKRDVAIKMLSDGLSIATIVKYTDLTEDQINEIKKEQKES